MEMTFLCLTPVEQVIKCSLNLFSTNCQWVHCITLLTQFLFDLLAEQDAHCHVKGKSSWIKGKTLSCLGEGIGI
jgi:hypothetical protein